jgi:hypothetical protein
MAAVILARPAAGAETPQTAAGKPVPVRSVFVMPSNTREGRDPFFPESVRPFEAVLAANKTVEISALSIKGFSGPPSHRLVIINNHTFGIGDEGDVLTPTGRVHLRCTQIGTDLVTIEVNGQRRELRLGAQ